MSLTWAVTLSCFFWFLDKFGSAIGEFYSLVAYFFKRDKFKSFRFDECQIFDYFFEHHSLCIMNKNCMRDKNAKFLRTNSFHDVLAYGTGVTPPLYKCT